MDPEAADLDLEELEEFLATATREQVNDYCRGQHLAARVSIAAYYAALPALTLPRPASLASA